MNQSQAPATNTLPWQAVQAPRSYPWDKPLRQPEPEPPRPEVPLADPDTLRLEIPSRMQAAQRWLLWRLEEGRKVPYYANLTRRQGVLDSPGDQAKLVTLEEALTALERRPGFLLGFALGPDGSGNWQGIDVDHVEEHPGHAELVEMLPGYRERSPSGTGYHAIGYGQHFAALASNASGVEAYSGGRYFTVTGWALGGDIADLAPFVGATLALLHRGPGIQASTDDRAAVQITPAQVSELRSALNAINPDDRGAWIAMGQALVELGDVGKALWLDWSQMSAKWQPTDAAKWDGFDGDHTGYGAVFARAQQAGWVNPASNAASMGGSASKAGGGMDPAASILATKPAEHWRLVPVRELLTDPEPLRWLVRGYVQPDSLNLLFGDPSAGKSLVAIDWAASLATGQPWNGHAPDQVPVIYLAGEGFFGIKRRLFAWALARECLEQLREAPLVVSSAGAALTDDAHVAIVAAAIDEIAAAHGQPGLIVVDTLARNFGAADENSAADVGTFIAAADFLRTRYQAAVLVVHHSGHGDKGRSRGSSAIRGAVDAEFCLSADAHGYRALTATKTKDAPPPEPLGFNLRVIDLPWQTEEGEAETSVVLEPDPGGADTPRRRKAPPSVALAFESLLACLDEAQEVPPDTWQSPAKAGPRPDLVAGLETWREEFISRHTGDSPETKGRAFRRAREQLTATGAVGVWRDLYWPRPDTAPWPDLAALLSAANLCRELNEAGEAGHSPDNRRTVSSCPDTDKERTLPGHCTDCPDMSGHDSRGVSECPPCPPVRQPKSGAEEECEVVI